jgi:GNAT superfamily N-acetyltransferase
MTREKPGYSSGALSLDPIRPDDMVVFREMLDELVEILDMTDVYAITDEGLRAAFLGESSPMEAIIARYDGEPAGIAIWSASLHMITGTEVMSLEYLYVRPPYRRHLITLAMLIYVLVLAKRRNYVRIEGFVHDWNSETADFYKRMKATEVSQKAYRLELSDIDWTEYQRFLED